jgi:hypothetical protein
MAERYEKELQEWERQRKEMAKATTRAWKCNREREHKNICYEGPKCSLDGCILLADLQPDQCVNLPPEAGETAMWKEIKIAEGSWDFHKLAVKVYSDMEWDLDRFAAVISDDICFNTPKPHEGKFLVLLLRETAVSHKSDTPTEHQEGDK